MTKVCISCKIEKNLSCFYFLAKTNRYENKCKECKINWQKSYYERNKEKVLDYGDRYYENNREKILISQKDYYEDNKENLIKYQIQYAKNHKEDKKIYDKNYRKQNKIKINESINRSRSRQYKNDPSSKLRKIVSIGIRNGLKKNGGSKNSESIEKYIPYTIEKLREHIENLFEPWMDWNNWGKYDPETYDNDNQSTWTWQIDHIIPHSTFQYSSMEDGDFQKCWSLENLRPLNSKQNFLDGFLKIKRVN